MLKSLSEPGKRSMMLRKTGTRTKKQLTFFSCFTIISQIKGDLGLQLSPYPYDFASGLIIHK